MSRSQIPLIFKQPTTSSFLTTRTLHRQALKVGPALSVQDGSRHRFLNTDSTLDCEAIAEQCLLEAKMIQQRNKRALTFSPTQALQTTTPPSNTLYSGSSVRIASISHATQSQRRIERFKRGKRKWQWKKEEEDKEEMGAWALLFVIFGVGGASIGGAGGLLQFWDAIGGSILDSL